MLGFHPALLTKGCSHLNITEKIFLIKFRFDISMKAMYEIELNRKRERIFNEFTHSLRFQNDQICSRIRVSKGLESY